MRTATMAALLALSAPAQGAVTREAYGTTAAGIPVERFTLTNKHGVSVSFLSYGGVVTSISVPDRSGHFDNILLALPDLQGYEARPNFSSLIGRVANRTSGGGVTIDGVRYPIAGGQDGISSHGGPGGFSTKVWRGTTFDDRHGSGVVLHYVSPDGENGYPGTLTVAVTYLLTPDDRFRIDYRATTTKPTLVNLTNHMFFNLGGPDAATVRDQTIRIGADAYTPVDGRKLPTGEIAPVNATALDLREPARIGDRIDLPDLAATKGFDHNFVVAKTPADGLVFAARATDPASGRTMTVETTEPGVQFYTAGAFDGSLIGAHGPLRRAAGFALETQHFPDSANHANFPSIVLRPGHAYRSTTIYSFGIERRAGEKPAAAMRGGGPAGEAVSSCNGSRKAPRGQCGDRRSAGRWCRC